MQYLLSGTSRAMLARLALQKTLCAFDFDGTLSPIVERPGEAGMRGQTRILLRRLAALYPCVIVSGRSRADVLARLRGVKVARVVGNHGAETEATVRIPRRRIEQWKASLELALGATPGLWVEDKDYSLAVHYRQSPRKTEANRRILEAARNLEQVRVVGGKQVVNLVLDSAPDKGDALAIERVRLGCSWVLYVGDDDTDEDAFALHGNVVPVRVGRKQRSHARYYLRTQIEMDRLLETLVRLRAP